MLRVLLQGLQASYCSGVADVTREQAIAIIAKCREYGPIHDPDNPEWAEDTILLDGNFTADELEAIAVMMRTASRENDRA